MAIFNNILVLAEEEGSARPYNGSMRSEFRKWSLWGIPLFLGTKKVVLSIKYQELSNGGPFWIATINPEHVMKAVEDKNYRELLNKTDVNVMDGVGLLWARALQEKFQSPNSNNQTMSNNQFSKLQTIARKLYFGFGVGVGVLRGKYRGELIPGSVLMKEMIEEAGRTGKKVFLLGGWGDRARRAALNFQSPNSNNQIITNNQFPKLQIEACPGEPEIANEEVIKKINKFRPDYLFVAYGMKKQEEWILRNKDKLKVGVVMGVGRSFDYYSGDLKMAPSWIRKIGLEWLYSLIQEPKRWRRQLALVRFVGRVVGGDSVE